MGNRIAEWFDRLFRPNPYRLPYEELMFCGVRQEQAAAILAKIAESPQRAEVDLAAAVEFAKAGVDGDEIVEAVRACRWVLESTRIAPYGSATREQMLATVETVAYLLAMTGDLYLARPIMRHVTDWLRSVQ